MPRRFFAFVVLAASFVAAQPPTASAVSRNDAATTVINTIIVGDPAADLIQAYGLQGPIQAGEQVSDGFAPNVVGGPPGTSWLFWIDYAPFADFAHPTKYVLVDTTSGSITLNADGQLWPHVGGLDFYRNEADRMGSPDQIYSGAAYPSVQPAPRPEPTVPDPRAPGLFRVQADSSKWALIVSAEDTLTNGRRRANVDSMRTILNQAFGVPTTNMTFSNNQNKAALCATIAAMAKKCPKLYVYFTGHGQPGYVYTGADSMFATEFASKLKALEAEEYCIMMSPCNTGSFIPVFRDSSLTGFHWTAAAAGSLALGWAPGDNTWTGNWFEHFWLGCVRQGLRGQEAFKWAADSLKAYNDSIRAAHPNWFKSGGGKLTDNQDPQSHQVFVHTGAGQATLICAPQGTKTICINWKPGQPEACSNVTIYCQVVPSPGDTTWKTEKLWNWNTGKTKYFHPFKDPLATGKYRLVSHANAYPSCGDITFRTDSLAENASDAIDFPAYTIGWVDGSADEFCFPQFPPSVFIQEGYPLDQIPQWVGQSPNGDYPIFVDFQLQADPTRPWLYNNGDPLLGYDGQVRIELHALGLFDPNGSPVTGLPLQVTVLQGPSHQQFNPFAQQTPSGVFIDPIFLGPMNPEPFLTIVEVAPPPGTSGGPPAIGYFEMDAMQVLFESTGTVSTPAPLPIAVTALQFQPPAPNPFVSNTRLRFAIPREQHVTLRVYDVTGRVIRTLANRTFPAGSHEVAWDGSSDAGGLARSGVYFVHGNSDGQTAVTRVVRMR